MIVSPCVLLRHSLRRTTRWRPPALPQRASFSRSTESTRRSKSRSIKKISNDDSVKDDEAKLLLAVFDGKISRIRHRPRRQQRRGLSRSEGAANAPSHDPANIGDSDLIRLVAKTSVHRSQAYEKKDGHEEKTWSKMRPNHIEVSSEFKGIHDSRRHIKGDIDESDMPQFTQTTPSAISKGDKTVIHDRNNGSWLTRLNNSTHDLLDKFTSNSGGNKVPAASRAASAAGPAPDHNILDEVILIDEKQETNKAFETTWKDTFLDVRGHVKPEQVLFVSITNKNLTEADFVRLIPLEAHHRPFARVIPIRDRDTLQKQNQYLVIFHDTASLAEWRKYVERLDLLSRKYTMRSLTHGEVVPQQDFSIKGEKIDQLVKAYALMPAGLAVHTNWNADVMGHFRNQLVQSGGYRQIILGTGIRRFGVLLRITGVHDITYTDVLQAIMYDGKSRNMVWDILLNAKGRLSAMIHLNSEEYQEEASDSVSVLKDSGADIDHEISLPRSTFSHPPAPFNSSAPAQIPDALRPSADAARYHDGQRWIVYFTHRAAAAGFVRTWHRRPLPLPSSNDPQYEFSEETRRVMERDGGKSTMVHAEVLW